MSNLTDSERTKLINALSKIAEEMTLMRLLFQNMDTVEVMRLARLFLENTVMKEIPK